jgi:hypothetical protein
MDIYIDIETAATRRADILKRVIDDIKPPATYKKPESIAEWWNTQGQAAQDDAISKTALSGTWGELFCIGFAVGDRDVQVIHNPSEQSLIEDFEHLLGEEVIRCNNDRGFVADSFTFVGHNIEFDLRFIWQRARVTGAMFNLELPLDRYPKASPYRYDTMIEWAGYGNRIKQSDLELAFNLERNDPLPNGGADVHVALQSGRHDDVFAHCYEDVRLLRLIHKRMIGIS